jgi:uncharacterized protein with HEPN domain
MPSRDWRLRLQDIVESINEILQRTAGMEFEDFTTHRTIVKAVLYDLGLIGEAARNIPSDIQSRYPQVPWRLIGEKQMQKVKIGVWSIQKKMRQPSSPL